MIKKGLLLLFAYYLVAIFQSCDLHYCEDVDYYNFTEISITESNNTIVADDSLHIQIQALNLDWMAHSQFGFDFFSKAYALACNEGWAGMKYPLTGIEFTSNADFNEDYPANSLLNELFKIQLCIADYYYDCDLQHLKLSEIDLKKFMNPQNSYRAVIYLAEKPSMEMEHVFTIKLLKSDGSVIIAETRSIIWE